jgi:hypothetical protein
MHPSVLGITYRVSKKKGDLGIKYKNYEKGGLEKTSDFQNSCIYTR